MEPIEPSSKQKEPRKMMVVLVEQDRVKVDDGYPKCIQRVSVIKTCIFPTMPCLNSWILSMESKWLGTELSFFAWPSVGQ